MQVSKSTTIAEVSMSAVPDQAADEARAQLQRIRDLAEFGLSADHATREDERQWYRSVLGAVGKILTEVQEAERNLSTRADNNRVLGPKEIAELAGLTESAIFRRRSR